MVYSDLYTLWRPGGCKDASGRGGSSVYPSGASLSYLLFKEHQPCISGGNYKSQNQSISIKFYSFVKSIYKSIYIDSNFPS